MTGKLKGKEKKAKQISISSKIWRMNSSRSFLVCFLLCILLHCSMTWIRLWDRSLCFFVQFQYWNNNFNSNFLTNIRFCLVCICDEWFVYDYVLMHLLTFKRLVTNILLISYSAKFSQNLWNFLQTGKAKNTKLCDLNGSETFSLIDSDWQVWFASLWFVIPNAK